MTASLAGAGQDVAREAKLDVPPQESLAPTKLKIEGLSKAYGDFQALHPLDLDIREGELLTLLGPSGSGKTTLLQLIAGLVKPSTGKLLMDDIDQTALPANQRDVGVVFQNYALFPHLTVSENVAFPLRMRGEPRAQTLERVKEVLEMVGMGHLGDRFPDALSGGQQQRVALARCMIYRPSLILMDESLSALDRKLRETMQMEIRRLHRETGATIVFVTHDQEEALALSDRICLMNGGRIEQVGRPEEIYEHPESVFAANFIGVSNLFAGKTTDRGVMETVFGSLPLPESIAGGIEGTLVVRPEHIALNGDDRYLEGEVVERVYAGAETRLLIQVAPELVVTARQAAGASMLEIGSRVGLGWAAENARFLTR
ncbi:ABC transporter ATP-binding protein [Salinicola rhizosphaerae]|uniref:ABC transporter ATP-binding protein n=1 Tax=Salinicola rhizosphaerae TaxID=1443141 RepID=UPI001E5DDAE4|nr:ABC transporter ATP-binding protein [Salinicola rhizosphaerae]